MASRDRRPSTRSLSLCLFIGAVYIYDQLGMPEGFWTDAPRPSLFRRFYEWRERRRERRWEEIANRAGAEGDGTDDADEDAAPWHLDGPLYHLMVETSRRVFTPAAAFAVAGFAALLYGTGNTPVRIGGALLLVLGFVYWAVHRPDLGAD